jgi:RecB family exonuclease
MITGLPPCKGTIDRAEGNFAARDVDLIDFKTGKKHTRKDLSNNIQACMYAIAFQKIYGFYPKRFIFLHSKFKCKQEIQITPDFLDAGLSRIKAIWYKIEREEFNPPESSKINKFFCKNFCLYYKGCPRHTRPAGWENVNYTKKII